MHCAPGWRHHLVRIVGGSGPRLAREHRFSRGPVGRPLAGALVETWSPTERLAGRITDSRGVFVFLATEIEGGTAITVRRIGYAPFRPSLTGSREYVVQLVPFAERLQPVIGVAAPLCPVRDDDDARALWASLARRHVPFRPGSHSWSAARVSEGRVPPHELGVVDSGSVAPGRMAAGGSYYADQTRTIREDGYAVPVRGLRRPRFDAWEDPYLESLLSGHVLDSAVLERHDLATTGTGREVAIVFCPRNADRPSIQGRMHLDPDSSLTTVTWTVQMENPAEQAGGEVLFGRASASGDAVPLYPLVGLYWRKLVFDYYQEWWEFREWKSCDTEPTVPECRN